MTLPASLQHRLRAAVAAALLLATLAAFRPPTPASSGCYRLRYSEPRQGAGPDLFPGAVRLWEGHRRGEVSSRASPSDTIGFWRMFERGGRWAPLSADSLQVNFSNGFSQIELRVRRAEGDTLRGVATFHWDVILPGGPPSMRLTGIPVSCRAVRLDRTT